VDSKSEANSLKFWVGANFFATNVVIKFIFCGKFLEFELTHALRRLAEEVRVGHILIDDIVFDLRGVYSETACELASNDLQLVLSDDARGSHVEVEEASGHSHHIHSGKSSGQSLLKAEQRCHLIDDVSLNGGASLHVGDDRGVVAYTSISLAWITVRREEGEWAQEVKHW